MFALSIRSPLRHLLLAAMLGVVSACSSYPSSSARAPQSVAESAGAVDSAALTQTTESQTTDPTAVQRQPQLVKSGTLTLTVDSVGQTIEKVVAIARQQQGDLLKLQDELPNSPGSRHLAQMQVRVPQQNLDALLKALTQIGTVQQQTISADDVSSQLVDNQARLRNLRKTEATLLEIMNRSGSVADVLKVAQELSKVRNSVEQIDGQLKDLQNQVAYSVVTINLQQESATIPAQPQLQAQVQETWEQATHSVGSFTVSLMKLGLWLLAYSPYWLALGLGAIALRRWLSRTGRVKPRAALKLKLLAQRIR